VRVLGVDDAAPGGLQADRTKQPRIERQGRVDGHQQRQDPGGQPGMCGAEARHIERRLHLRIGAREIDRQVTVRDRNRDADAHRGGAQAIAVEKVDRPVGAVAQAAEDCRRLGGRFVEHIVAGLEEQFLAVGGDELLDPAAGGGECSEHRLEVALVGVRGAGIALQQGLDVGGDDAFADELDGRNLQPFGEDRGVERADRAGHTPTDIGAVHERPAVRNDLAVHEIRLDHLHIGQVSGQTVGGERIVGDDHVAGTQRLPVADPLDCRGDAQADEARDPHRVRVGDEGAVAVGDGAGEVRGLLDVQAARGALQGQAHLLGERAQSGAEDLQIDSRSHSVSSLVNSRSRLVRRVAVQPGGATIVVSWCSMIA